jgi:N-acetylneuraminate synthase
MKQKNFIKIGNRKIGTSFKPLVIFELGINHNGSLKLAKKIVDSAIKAGAEIIKHQTHIAEDEMSLEAKKIVPINANKNIYDLIKEASLNEKEEWELKKYIEKKKAIFLSTPFSRKAVDRLVKFKVKAFKIGSGECNNYPLVDYIASFGKPIIISTGMNDVSSIKKAIKILKKRKVPRELILLNGLTFISSGFIFLHISVPALSRYFHKK